MTSSYQTTIGHDEQGTFIGEGECKIQFTDPEMNSLFYAQLHSRDIAEVFVNYCKLTFASGSIPSFFRQDLSPEEIASCIERLDDFKDNFANAMFSIMLAFEY